MICYYYACMHYSKKGQGLYSLIDTNLISSCRYGNEFNFDDNYGGYY